MMCQNCRKNEANVRYTQIINGVKKEIKVCDKCAMELGLDSFEFNMPIHFSDFLGNFFNDYETDLLPTFNRNVRQLCNNCGETYDEFTKTGLLGCQNDYNIFDEELDYILRKIQGDNRHIGRSPILNQNNLKNKKIENNDRTEKAKEDRDSDDKLNELQEKLKQSIKEERYEEAAKIRDEIKLILDKGNKE